ncbi:transport system membrane protein [Gluconacetobacter liquefaciens]|uniref:MdtA/MuxA family multidrug efflux RND transporter periplasmic adaptor subunit n=1 Tax=Gluconacetobacter liquefaciens TaxID=89584 RepID=A0A370G8R6_GLULI|nr:MdtA/MuxA family multidrug efflux RND transporter periplasmic adaptor subunit [Gluconacetobacter liquefaciens]MBB2185790.1 MdtA/MuxA family multidrug efflux RND transporter periplasmic adaptor subunit [Gluconacetobacter liquefaciens]RDI39600.1 multidrug efflux system membrane fusion protein [Gluconacetobacter liquefaciens]GBQ92545.1 multidrug efflux pump acriflavin resistance protein AcrB/AcrD/AcrF [Gluconacetobacter liquefaciens NRIC 0522]GEB36238.1 transport system membrane protein [Glucon
MDKPTLDPSDAPAQQSTGRGRQGSAGNKSRRRLLLWGTALVGAAVIAAAFLRPHAQSGGGRHAHQMAADVQPVAVAIVRKGDMPVELTELGTVIPITNVTVQSRVDGYLMQVLFTEGQHVKKGDLLALIDTRPYEVLLAQYQGQLASDIAQLEQARVDNARYQRLIRQNSIAAQTAVDQQYKVAQLEGTVKVDQAQVDNEKLQIIYCHVIAPVDGRVGIRQVDMGNYITAGQTNGLVILTQMQPISVIFTLPETELGRVAERLRSGVSLPVEAWDSTNTRKLADGAVSVLDSQIDTATGTIKLRSIFPNQDETLFPNQFVNAHLLVNTEHDVLLLPANAVQTGPSGSFVYVVKSDNTVEVRDIATGTSHGDSVVVTSGLKEGESVVTDGTDHLRAGAKVTIPTATDSTAAPGDATTPAAGQGHRHRRHNASGQGDMTGSTTGGTTDGTTGSPSGGQPQQ